MQARGRGWLVALVGAVVIGGPLVAQSQHEQNQAAWRAAEEADRRLNQVYRELVAALPDKTAVTKLRDAQRAWIKFRDLECAFAGDEMRDGSAEPLLRAGCQRRLTEERTRQLEAHLESYGRGPSANP